MKKILITILILCLFASLGFAQAHKGGAHKGGGLVALIAGAAQGDIIYWDGTAWVLLNIGSNTNVLTSNGTIPTWGAGGGGGWTDDGTVVRLTTSTDEVAIGTATGGAVLTIDGNKATKNLLEVINDDDGAVGDSSAVVNKHGYLGIGTAPTVPLEVTGSVSNNTMKVEKYIAITNAADGGIRTTWDSDVGLALIDGNGTFVTSGLGDPIYLRVNSGDVAIKIESDKTVVQDVFVIRKHVALSGATDNVATNIFTITTADETGSADGGMYSVHVHLTVGEATAASGAVNTASIGLGVRWTRIMASAGTGANSAVIEIGETASANEGSGAISLVTVTVTETSEFVQQVLVVANTSGGTFDAFCMVEVVYSDFSTPPVIN